MLYTDGAASYWLIQHEEKGGGWKASALGHFLFDGLSSDNSRGSLGDHYRALIAPQSANADLWQKYAIHGYVVLEHAQRTLVALRERHPDRKFRIVRRTVTQKTEPLEGV